MIFCPRSLSFFGWSADLADHGVYHTAEEIDVLKFELALALQGIQGRGERSQRIGFFDFPMPLVAEHRRRFLDDDMSVIRLEADVQIRIDAHAQAIPYLPLRPRPLSDPGSRLLLHGNDDGIEQGLLVLEVVIERAPRHPRRP